MGETLRHFFARQSYRWLVPLALLTAVAPWPASGAPHMVQKLDMLRGGLLVRPLDIFDLIFHGAAPVLILAKAAVRCCGDERSEQAGESTPGGR